MLSLLVVHQAGLFLFCPFIHLVSTSLAFSHFRLPSFPPHLPAVSQEKQTFGPRSSYTVEGLKANTEYSFSLAAISNKGIGAFTNELVQKTSQASTSVFVFDARMLTHTHAAILLFRSSGISGIFTLLSLHRQHSPPSLFPPLCWSVPFLMHTRFLCFLFLLLPFLL